MPDFIDTIFVLDYFAGCSHFDKEVRDACTHGICKCNWSSKYNKLEQALAKLANNVG